MDLRICLSDGLDFFQYGGDRGCGRCLSACDRLHLLLCCRFRLGLSGGGCEDFLHRRRGGHCGGCLGRRDGEYLFQRLDFLLGLRLCDGRGRLGHRGGLHVLFRGGDFLRQHFLLRDCREHGGWGLGDDAGPRLLLCLGDC